jgi:hypothetical protein
VILAILPEPLLVAKPDAVVPPADGAEKVIGIVADGT